MLHGDHGNRPGVESEACCPAPRGVWQIMPALAEVRVRQSSGAKAALRGRNWLLELRLGISAIAVDKLCLDFEWQEPKARNCARSCTTSFR